MPEQFLNLATLPGRIREGTIMAFSHPVRRWNEENLINSAIDSETQYWSEKFNISQELLCKIIQVVGPHPNAVEHELEVGGRGFRRPDIGY
jgi:hypothetical protein